MVPIPSWDKGAIQSQRAPRLCLTKGSFHLASIGGAFCGLTDGPIEIQNQSGMGGAARILNVT